jgi:hypothetical protein
MTIVPSLRAKRSNPAEPRIGFWIASAYAQSASADSKRAIARKASDGRSSLALLAMTFKDAEK